MKVRVGDGNQERLLSIRRLKEGVYEVIEDGEIRLFHARSRANGEWIVDNNGRQRVWSVLEGPNHVRVASRGQHWDLWANDASRGNHGNGSESSKGYIATPMPGVVVRIAVAEGDAVTKGDVLCVVEAMKMENEYRADVTGTVDTIHISLGQALDAGAALITILPTES